MFYLIRRIFAGFTYFSYLLVGVIVFRFYSTQPIEIRINLSLLNSFSKTHIENKEQESLKFPEMNLAKWQFDLHKEGQIAKNESSNLAGREPRKRLFQRERIANNHSRTTLPFDEFIKLNPLKISEGMNRIKLGLLVSDSRGLPKLAKIHQDEIKTIQSSQVQDEEDDLNFYSINKLEESEERKVAHVNNEKISDANIEEVDIQDLVSFNYKALKKDMEKKPEKKLAEIKNKVFDDFFQGKEKESFQELNNFLPKIDNRKSSSTIFENKINLKVVGIDLKNSKEIKGFEVRPRDDLKESFFDYNTGKISLNHKMTGPRMTRSVSFLKHGFSPTNVDIILEEGVTELNVPMFQENNLKKLMVASGANENTGAVLIEISEDTKTTELDVPYKIKIKLDEDLKETKSSDFVYELYLGVFPGNAILNVKNENNENVSKIIHVHENELTFETYFDERVEGEEVILDEENLLSKEKNPLIISTNQIKQLFFQKKVIKKNSNSFRTNFNKTNLGGRKYLELLHLREPIYVGFKNRSRLSIPSGDLVSYILSSLDETKLSNRCVIQVNLSRPVNSVEVGSEAVADNIEATIQVLDNDGKFYETVSSKSRKLIVFGEFVGSADVKLNGRINFKINYLDGSTEYFPSYCSSGAYFVEQL